MTQLIKSYAAALLIFGILEMTWLSTFAPSIYRPALDPIMAEQPNALAGLSFFIIYPIGITYFAILPARGQWRSAIIRGALLGFICYATYDLTNFATLKGWNISIMIFDLGWGATVTALSATIATAMLNRLSHHKARDNDHHARAKSQ